MIVSSLFVRYERGDLDCSEHEAHRASVCLLSNSAGTNDDQLEQASIFCCPPSALYIQARVAPDACHRAEREGDGDRAVLNERWRSGARQGTTIARPRRYLDEVRAAFCLLPESARRIYKVLQGFSLFKVVMPTRVALSSARLIAPFTSLI